MSPPAVALSPGVMRTEGWADYALIDSGGGRKLERYGGYKVVQVVGKTPLQPKPEYVAMVKKEIGGGLESARPMSSVIKTISGN